MINDIATTMGAPQLGDRLQEDLHQVLIDADIVDGPGVSLRVLDQGRTVYEWHHGLAAIASGAPIGPATRFRLGSLSKQFTAFAVARLILEQRLGYDDAMRKYIPEFPPYANTVRIRDLIHHSSGIRDITSLVRISGRNAPVELDRAVRVLAILTRQSSLNCEPGHEFLYSNSNYFLLGVIVERITGTAFDQVLNDCVFAPLGMSTATARRGSHPATAVHYERAADRHWSAVDPPEGLIGADGIYASVDDLARWESLFAGVGKADPWIGKAFAMLKSRGTLKNGRRLGYAWGWRHGMHRGRAALFHFGSARGLDHAYVRLVVDGQGIIVLCNCSYEQAFRLFSLCADKFWAAGSGEHNLVLVRESERPVQVAGDASLTKYAGWFHNEELDATYALRCDDGGVHLTSEGLDLRLQPVGDGALAGAGITLRFIYDSTGFATELIVDTRMNRNIRFRRI